MKAFFRESSSSLYSPDSMFLSCCRSERSDMFPSSKSLSSTQARFLRSRQLLTPTGGPYGCVQKSHTSVNKNMLGETLHVDAEKDRKYTSNPHTKVLRKKLTAPQEKTPAFRQRSMLANVIVRLFLFCIVVLSQAKHNNGLNCDHLKSTTMCFSGLCHLCVELPVCFVRLDGASVKNGQWALFSSLAWRPAWWNNALCVDNEHRERIPNWPKPL